MISTAQEKKNNLKVKTNEAWTIDSAGLSPVDIQENGNRMFSGNGYMGYRGTTEDSMKSDMGALIVNGMYDKQGEAWREPVNFPDPFKMRAKVNGVHLTIHNDKHLTSHLQSINFKHSLFSRKSIWKIDKNTVSIETQRFISMDNPHLLCLKYSVSATAVCEVELFSGINTDVYNANGSHFTVIKHNTEDFFSEAESTAQKIITNIDLETQELQIPFTVSRVISYEQKEAISIISKSEEGAGLFGTKFLCTVIPDAALTFFVYGGVFCGNDYDLSRNTISSRCASDTQKMLSACVPLGYETLLDNHVERWNQLWQCGDVTIEGDDEAQKALRYSLYHLHCIAPRNNRDLSIPARGLSGQTYKGAIFWDTEIFISPYFLYTEPAVAKNLIRYRIKTLDGARRKAREYGFVGAFYAWESQESGDDACTDYNVTDVFTKRPVRTYFRDKQIHISSSIVYAISQYLDATGDLSVLLEGGLEVIIECARFYLSRCVYLPLKKRYELHDVIGPDEYHERVNNNAYTNKMALFTIQTALNCIDRVRLEQSDIFKEIFESLKIEKDIDLLKEVVASLYIPSPLTDVSDEKKSIKHIIPQFDGYFDLEDCSVETVKNRLLDPQEYWGGSHGVASDTQVIKQADVIVLLNLFPDEYSKTIKKDNFDYYAPRTEHGSSLSSCMYALLACNIGTPEWAYPFFMKTAQVDMSGHSKQFAGLVYIGGTHPAASGGAWMSVVQGFCGFRIRNGKIFLSPALPSVWKRVSFKVSVLGLLYEITVTHEGYTICNI